jgi:hypothetical protein
LNSLIITCFALTFACLILELVTLIVKHTLPGRPVTNNLFPIYRYKLSLMAPLRPSGGGRSHVFTQKILDPYLVASISPLSDKLTYKFVDHVDNIGLCHYPIDQGYVHVNIPLQQLIPLLSGPSVFNIARIHKIAMGSHTLRKHMQTYFDYHNCISCNLYCSVFECTTVKPCILPDAPKTKGTVRHTISDQPATFPPTPLDSTLSHKIINNFCADSEPTKLEEAGCAVCGRLTCVKELTKLKSVGNLLHILNVPGVTRVERMKISDKIEECPGPVLDNTCD